MHPLLGLWRSSAAGVAEASGESGLDDEAAQKVVRILHPFEAGIDQRGDVVEVVSGGFGQSQPHRSMQKIRPSHCCPRQPNRTSATDIEKPRVARERQSALPEPGSLDQGAQCSVKRAVLLECDRTSAELLPLLSGLIARKRVLSG